ncbi:hypothetical protein BBF96_07895 [Anoxybacter fermentans]|uniref:SPOR domain-containing protein n=1 Tax=Anoxybacter fermentans TaxID=1323375 RepID=A0A3Q9HQC5_9FIRM|nr:SPOR domain-containing protein [Anoxybacter fermentans]AZR73311.1 hypothetical protein BBF96_07895 [Anoxybacter fermentans]
MNRSRRYGNTNISLMVGVIVMAVTAVALGYLLGSWMIQFVTGSEIDPVTSGPIKNEVVINNQDELEGEEPATINIPENRYTPNLEQEGLYIVQLGAFNNYANAERLRNELLEKGYTSVIITEGPPYKVQLRASKTKKEAEELKKQVKQDGYVDVFIVH